jgi:hypothetical protein
MFSKTLKSMMCGGLIGITGMSASTNAFADCTSTNCPSFQIRFDINCGSCVPGLEALLRDYMANNPDVKATITLRPQTIAISAQKMEKRFVERGVPAANIKVTVAPKMLRVRPINRPIDSQR